MVSKRCTRRGKERVTVRSFVVLSLVRSFVCRRGINIMTMERQKSDDEGKKEQKLGRAEKNIL
jgi:hypothetical protein